MTIVFVVQHVHPMPDDTEDVKFIGVYSSRSTAQNAVDRLSQQPGFSDAEDGFSIDESRVDQDQWAAGYATVPHG